MNAQEAITLCRFVKGACPQQAIDEEWRPVPDFPLYVVSNYGRIWSSRKTRGVEGRIMRLVPDDKGYMTTRLVNESGGKTIKAHVLVAQVFIGPRPDGLQVRHLDSDKTNNALSNLAYGTQLENMADRVALKTHCKNDHPFDEANTRPRPGGGRACRTCERAADQRRRSRRKAVA